MQNENVFKVGDRVRLIGWASLPLAKHWIKAGTILQIIRVELAEKPGWTKFNYIVVNPKRPNKKVRTWSHSLEKFVGLSHHV
jgi:hypothetical protein